MDPTSEPEAAPVVRISRLFRAPVPQVFRAWTSAAHVPHWFCPLGYSVPTARVEARAGGVFELCMRADSDGAEHWVRGVFRQFEEGRRLHIEMPVGPEAGPPLFVAHTAVTFSSDGQGTRVDVEQRYDFHHPAARGMAAGAAIGWQQTLDRLDSLLARQAGALPAMHDTFHLERQLAASPQRVWRAFAEAEAKERWFSGQPGQWTVLERHLDVRPGGSERLRGRWASGMVTDFRCSYHDVVPMERLIYTYEMYLDERKISVSLATVEIRPAEGGSLLRVTEQGAFLNGYEDGGSRRRGTAELIERLAASLD